MENLNGYFLAMILNEWIRYIFWIIIFSGIITAGITGLKRNNNKGFIFILISGCLGLIYHFPSIYFKGFYAMRRLTAAGYAELYQMSSFADSFIFSLIAVLSLTGLFFIALKKN